MFGLFRKKPKSQPMPVHIVYPAQGTAPAHAHSRSEDRVAQPSSGATFKILEWDAAITRIKRGLEAQLVQGIAESEPLIASMQGDFAAIDRLWMKIEREVETSKRALSNAWSASRGTLLRDPSIGEERLAFEEEKLHIQCGELELAFETAQRQVRARAAQATLEFALQEDARSRYCVGCAQPMLGIFVGHSQNIQCPICGLVQSAEPGNSHRIFASGAARWVGEWDAIGHYQKMKRAELRIQRFRNRRDVPLELLCEFHSASLHYWQTVLGVEAHLVPSLEKHLARALEARLKDAFRLLRGHWQWRAYEQAQL